MDKKYECYGMGGTCYRMGDWILLFDLRENEAWLVEVLDVAHLSVSKTDDHDLMACKRVQGFSTKHLTEMMWKCLEALAILKNREDANVPSKIPRQKWDGLLQVFQED